MKQIDINDLLAIQFPFKVGDHVIIKWDAGLNVLGPQWATIQEISTTNDCGKFTIHVVFADIDSKEPFKMEIPLTEQLGEWIKETEFITLVENVIPMCDHEEKYKERFFTGPLTIESIHEALGLNPTTAIMKI